MFVGVAHLNVKRLLSRARIAVLHYIYLCLRVVAHAKSAVSVEQVDPGICPRTSNKDNIVLLDLAHTQIASEADLSFRWIHLRQSLEFRDDPQVRKARILALNEAQTRGVPSRTEV